MDLGKRKFLQQLGVLTAGASLVPLSQAGIKLSPERREGSEDKRYGMLIDLRRCVGCQSCTVSCTIENQTPQGQFRTTVNQYQVAIKGQEGITNVLLPRYVTIVTSLRVYLFVLFKQHFNAKTGSS